MQVIVQFKGYIEIPDGTEQDDYLMVVDETIEDLLKSGLSLVDCGAVWIEKVLQDKGQGG